MQTTNRFSQYDFTTTLTQVTPAPAREVSPTPTEGAPSSTPQLTNALIRDLLDPTVDTLDLCDYHELTLNQLLTILKSPEFEFLEAAIEQINTARTNLVDHEATFTAKARLNELCKQHPTDRHHQETIRKAASKLATKTKTPKHKVPKSTTSDTLGHDHIQATTWTLHPATSSTTLKLPHPTHKPAASRERPYMFKIITPLVLAAAAASATPVQAPDPFMYTDPITGERLCGFLFDISGYTSNDFQGSAINDTLEIFLGAGSEIGAISWDINLSTVGFSWASEATIGFEDQVFLTPGIGDDFTVSNANYSSNGPIHLSDVGLPDIQLGADGILNIEFFESGFDDNPGAPDAIYGPGSTLGIYTSGWPTPGTASALAFAGLIASRRRR